MINNIFRMYLNVELCIVLTVDRRETPFKNKLNDKSKNENRYLNI